MHANSTSSNWTIEKIHGVSEGKLNKMFRNLGLKHRNPTPLYGQVLYGHPVLPRQPYTVPYSTSNPNAHYASSSPVSAPYVISAPLPLYPPPSYLPPAPSYHYSVRPPVALTPPPYHSPVPPAPSYGTLVPPHPSPVASYSPPLPHYHPPTLPYEPPAHSYPTQSLSSNPSDLSYNSPDPVVPHYEPPIPSPFYDSEPYNHAEALAHQSAFGNNSEADTYALEGTPPASSDSYSPESSHLPSSNHIDEAPTNESEKDFPTLFYPQKNLVSDTYYRPGFKYNPRP